MGCGVGKRQPVPPPRTAAAGTAHAAAAVHRNAANARPWDVGWGSASPSLRRARPRPELRTPRRPCTGTLRTRGHGMWGEEAPARPSAAHARGRNCARLRQSCTETTRTRGRGMWGEEAPARPSAAHGRGRNCVRLRQLCTETTRTRGLGRALRQTRPWAAGHGRSPRRIRPPSRSRRTAPPASARRFPEGPAAARKNGARPPHPAVARLPFSLPPRRLRQPCKPRSWRSMFSITTS